MRPCRLSLASAFEQEPDAPFCFVNPILEQAHACHIVEAAADEMRVAHEAGQPLVVATQLGEHQGRRDKIGVIAGEPRQADDVLHRSERAAADFADTLGNGVSIRLLVQKHVIVAKVRAGHVPVKVLGLEIECEHVRQERVEGRCDLCRALAVVGVQKKICCLRRR